MTAPTPREVHVHDGEWCVACLAQGGRDALEFATRREPLDDSYNAAQMDKWAALTPEERLAAHQDDSYGGCVICREWVPGTDDESFKMRFPCPTVILARREPLDVEVLRKAASLTWERYGYEVMPWPQHMWTTLAAEYARLEAER